MGQTQHRGEDQRMHSALWWQDFEFGKGMVTVKKTGARVPLEPGVIGDVLTWLPFYAVVESWRLKGTAASAPRIWFAPDRPRPWYLIWAVIHAAGTRIADTPEEADIVFHFDDSTTSDATDHPAGLPAINRDCASIEKSHVARVFEAVFGYSLSVDPRQWTGPMVIKSEKNGAHDGRIITGPCEPQPGCVYQRVIDNSTERGLVEDLRCPTIGGHIPLVMPKRRRAENRFANTNDEVSVCETDTVLSRREQDQLADFARAMKLDWGGLDVLRNREDGRIYVVDVNKTDMGPPIALSLDDKIRVTRRLADAFLDYLHTGLKYSRNQ